MVPRWLPAYRKPSGVRSLPLISWPLSVSGGCGAGAKRTTAPSRVGRCWVSPLHGGRVHERRSGGPATCAFSYLYGGGSRIEPRVPARSCIFPPPVRPHRPHTRTPQAPAPPDPQTPTPRPPTRTAPTPPHRPPATGSARISARTVPWRAPWSHAGGTTRGGARWRAGGHPRSGCRGVGRGRGSAS